MTPYKTTNKHKLMDTPTNETKQLILEHERMREVGDRMKQRERNYESNIPNDSGYMVRLDGHGFSKFTKGFHQPFDIRFTQAMVFTMNDLLDIFQAKTGYTHSDEITLIFSPAQSPDNQDDTVREHLLKARTQKLATLMAGCASSRFNHHLQQIMKNVKPGEYTDNHLNKFIGGVAYFDARIFVTSDKEAVEFLEHRSRYDCPRNCVSAYAMAHFSSKQLHKVNMQQAIDMLLEEKGIDWHTVCPEHFKTGVYAKKVLYEKLIEVGPDKGKMCTRGRIENRCLPDKATVTPDLVWGKYWPADVKIGKEFYG